MVARIVSVGIVLGLMWSAPQPIMADEEHEVPESAVSSPPMEMDDPGTPGPQGVEVNLVGTLLHAGPIDVSETLLDANLGIGDRLQLKLERPYLTHGGDGNGAQRGLGPTEFGVKWRFVERNGLEVALYPQYSFDDGFALKDEEGNLETSEGRNYYVPLLISRSVGRATTLAVNLGYRRNLENRGDDFNVAVGAGRALGEHARALVEVFSERDRDFHNRQTDVRIGWAGALFPGSLKGSRFELGSFASIGSSIGATEEGETSKSFTLGMSLVKKPRE